MTPTALSSLAAHAGRRLHPDGASGPYPFGRGVPVACLKAVYLVCDWGGRCLYVGSTVVGVRARVAQHAADYRRTLTWCSVYVVPLRDDTSNSEVRRIEGRIGVDACPLQNKALPRIA